MISSVGDSRARFQPLGWLSAVSGQIRSDRPFSMVSGLGGSWARRLLPVSGQTRSDHLLSMIPGLGGSWDRFRPLGCLSRVSGQIRSDH